MEQFQSCFGPLILDHKETTTMNASRVSLVGKALDFGSFRDSWFESQPLHFVFLPFFKFACHMPKSALDLKDYGGKFVILQPL